jgi:elongation factor G
VTKRALLSLTIKPRTSADQEKLARGIGTLMSEDPTMSATVDSATGEAVIGGMGESHLEGVLDRLTREFNVEATVGRLEVVYLETVTSPADGEGRYVRHGSGHSEYAHAKVHLYPGAPGSGYVFENAIVGGILPSAFIKSIDEGIEQALAAGVISRYPIDDVRVVLYDGSYHDVDSSEASFKMAGSMAFHDAARKAKPVLLEPVMRVKVTVPGEHAADVTTTLSTRRAEMLSVDRSFDGRKRITASVPLSELLGYQDAFRRSTVQGAAFTLEFAGYRPFNPGENRDAGGHSFVAAPRRPTPTLRDSGVALPEPRDESLD